MWGPMSDARAILTAIQATRERIDTLRVMPFIGLTPFSWIGYFSAIWTAWPSGSRTINERLILLEGSGDSTTPDETKTERDFVRPAAISPAEVATSRVCQCTRSFGFS